MTPEQQCAYVNAQNISALIEALGMFSENLNRYGKGESIAYTKETFDNLILQYGIHHNAVIGHFID